MNTTFLDALARQILEFTRDNLSARLIAALNEGQVQGKSNEEIVKSVFTKFIDEIPKTTVSSTRKGSSTTNSNSSVTATKEKTTSSRSKADVLKDDNGQDIACAGIIKRTNAPCPHGARVTVSGKHYCRVHARSATGAQPDPSMKPGTKTAVRQASSFQSVIGISPNISALNVDDVGDIADDD